MTEPESDLRNEVFLSKQMVDSLSGYIIRKKEVSLKSMTMGMAELLEAAKKEMKEE